MNYLFEGIIILLWHLHSEIGLDVLLKKDDVPFTSIQVCDS